MKSILLASALMIGGTAFAQTEQAPPPPAATTMQPADTMAAPTPGTTGSGTIVTQEGGNMTAPPASAEPYPRCTRTVTDHCHQGSARESDTKGGPPAHRRHKRR